MSEAEYKVGDEFFVELVKGYAYGFITSIENQKYNIEYYPSEGGKKMRELIETDVPLGKFIQDSIVNKIHESFINPEKNVNAKKNITLATKRLTRANSTYKKKKIIDNLADQYDAVIAGINTGTFDDGPFNELCDTLKQLDLNLNLDDLKETYNNLKDKARRHRSTSSRLTTRKIKNLYYKCIKH